MIIRATTLDDPRLALYSQLTDVQLRSSLEAEHGIFIAESLKVIDRALRAGLQPLSFLMEEKWLPKMEDLLQNAGMDVESVTLFVLPHEQVERLAGFEVTRGVLAAFERPQLPSVADVLSNASRVAVLEDITNHTNVGAIFRSAAALGIEGVLVTPGCYDPLYRRAIRVSMGTVFQVSWTRIGDDVTGTGAHGNVYRKGGWMKTGLPLLHGHGFKVAAMALSEDSVGIDDPRLKAEPKLAIVLGTEGEGLSNNTIAGADYVARIPMQYGVDSLNVAAASAVAFWELRKR